MKKCIISGCDETEKLTEVDSDKVGNDDGVLYYQPPTYLCEKHLKERSKPQNE